MIINVREIITLYLCTFRFRKIVCVSHRMKDNCYKVLYNNEIIIIKDFIFHINALNNWDYMCLVIRQKYNNRI